MKGVHTMFTLTRSIPVNDRSDPELPILNRDQVWKGLELKAENALPFVPQMTQCDTIERGNNYLVRNIVLRGEPAGERVTFYPKRMVQFDRLSGNTLGTIKNEIEEDTSGNLFLRFTFALEREGIAPASAEEEAYARQIEGDYLGAVQATLTAIRRWVKEGTLDAQSAV
jgi:hypothetical protein